MYVTMETTSGLLLECMRDKLWGRTPTSKFLSLLFHSSVPPSSVIHVSDETLE